MFSRRNLGLDRMGDYFAYHGRHGVIVVAGRMAILAGVIVVLAIIATLAFRFLF